MKLKRPRLSLTALRKNKPLLIGVIVGGVILVIALLALALRLQYQQQTTTWSQKAGSLIRDYSAKFQAVQKDSVAFSEAVDAFYAELQSTKPPAAPQLLFVPLETSDEATRRQAATEHTNSLLATLEAIKTATAYQAAVATELQKLSGQSAQDAAQLKALSATWQQVTTAIQSIQAPEPLHDFHAKLTTHLGECNQELAALPPLFESQDRAGFLARQDALNQKITTIQGLTTDLGNYLKTLDDSLNQAGQNLGANAR